MMSEEMRISWPDGEPEIPIVQMPPYWEDFPKIRCKECGVLLFKGYMLGCIKCRSCDEINAFALYMPRKGTL